MKTLFRAVDPEFRPYGRLLPIEDEALKPPVKAAAALDMPERSRDMKLRRKI